MTTGIDEKSAVEALIKVAEDYAWEHRRPGGGYDLPEGLALEMHPSVMRLLMMHWHPGYADLLPGHQPRVLADIPVRVTMDLPRHTWRLAVVTVEVINGGKMPDPRPAQ